MKNIILIFSIVLYACAPVGRRTNRRNIDEYVVPSHTVQYFLPDLPTWTNYSVSSECTRDNLIRFVNFERLQNSFRYSHEQITALQQAFNLERRNILEGRRRRALGFKEEEELFYKTMDSVQAGARVFVRPDFDRIHLVWIDPFVTKRKDVRNLKQLFDNKTFVLGHPVFISLCLSYEGVGRFIGGHGFTDAVRILSSELLTPYDGRFKLVHRLKLYIDPLFKSSQRLYFYTPTVVPDDIVGKFTGTEVF